MYVISFLTEDIFSLFFSCLFFHLCYAKFKSWNDSLMTYGRDRWLAHSYMPRHTVPLFIHQKSLTGSLCLYLHSLNPSIWRAREIRHPSKPVLSYFSIFLFGAVLDNSTWLWREGFPQAQCQSDIQCCSHLPCREYSSVAVLLWGLDKSIWFASA